MLYPKCWFCGCDSFFASPGTLQVGFKSREVLEMSCNNCRMSWWSFDARAIQSVKDEMANRPQDVQKFNVRKELI